MQPINLSDYEALAEQRMAHIPWAWDYYQGGSDDEVSLRANRVAFEQLRLRPRMLLDVSTCDIRTSVLGIPVSMLILVAPTAGHGLAHADAECATARAIQQAGTLMIVSTQSTCSLEEIAQAGKSPRWFQLYIDSYRQAEHLVRRAEAAGYQGLVLTVDGPRRGNRERDIRNHLGDFLQTHYPAVGNGIASPLMQESSSEEETSMTSSLTWEILPWLRSLTKLPIILKGISRQKMRALLSPMELLGLLSPTTVAANSIVSLLALKYCPKWSRPLLANWKSTSMAAFVAGRMSSKPWHSALVLSYLAALFFGAWRSTGKAVCIMS
jgi:isopentenyl diphosphate isomerase/L-lactate dehydrogenase-like FMN-dependent dehydrogenase